MRFIVLTHSSTKQKIRFNVTTIVSYCQSNNLTFITIIGGDEETVVETPEEIDTLLITNGILVHTKD